MFLSKYIETKSKGKFTLSHFEDYSLLQLHNPESRNAISIKMMIQLTDIIEKLESQPPKVLILYGEKTFCAGGDLNDVRQHLMASGKEMSIHMSGLLNRVFRLPSFVIAAVDGAAIGGGAEFTTVADYIVCQQEAKIGFVHAKLGVSPGWGGAKRLSERVGKTTAKHVLCFAKRYSANEAISIRLIDEISDETSALPMAIRRAMDLKYSDTASLKGCLNIINGQDSEHLVFSELWGSSTHRKALGISE